jgi:hypothetical protein
MTMFALIFNIFDLDNDHIIRFNEENLLQNHHIHTFRYDQKKDK